MKNPSQDATNNVAQNQPKVNMFETLKRNYETAYANGNDYTGALYDLAAAIAQSVLNKCIDPQRSTAGQNDKISDNGHNPAMIELKRGIGHDLRTLKNTTYTANQATRAIYNANGELATEITDKEANNAFAKLVDETLSDGIDLVQTAIVALLEQATEHANGLNWLDEVYIVHRLSRRVYIKLEDSAAYRDETTTPIQEVYRAVRRAVQDSRATATDPRNGYSYIEELTVDGLDTIYYRLHKHADLGGYNSDNQYTVDRQSAVDYEAIIERLNLTARQATIISLRMQGKGVRQIATYLGVTPAAVKIQLYRLRDRCADLGFTPQGYNK